MKKYLSLLLGAATVASASAAITVDKQDLTMRLSIQVIVRLTSTMTVFSTSFIPEKCASRPAAV